MTRETPATSDGFARGGASRQGLFEVTVVCAAVCKCEMPNAPVRRALGLFS